MLVKLYLITILISSLISVYNFNKLEKHLKAFSIFLLITLAVECVGYFLLKTNVWLFNIFTALEFVFYLLLFRHTLTSISQKKIIIFFIASTILASLGNMLFFQGLFKFNNYSYSYGCMLICICVIMYLLQLLHHSNPQPLTHIPMFWISTGLLIFYACNFFYMGLLNYLISVSMEIAKELFMIISVLNIVMYSLFSVGIICSTTRRR